MSYNIVYRNNYDYHSIISNASNDSTYIYDENGTYIQLTNLSPDTEAICHKVVIMEVRWVRRYYSRRVPLSVLFQHKLDGNFMELN